MVGVVEGAAHVGEDAGAQQPLVVARQQGGETILASSVNRTCASSRRPRSAYNSARKHRNIGYHQMRSAESRHHGLESLEPALLSSEPCLV